MKNVRIVTPNLQQAWLEDELIVWFKPYGTSRETFDDWFNLVAETATNWDSTRPYLAIHDMRNSAVTPYAQQRAQDLAGRVTHLHGRTAIVIKEAFLSPMVNFFLNRTLQDEQRSVEYRQFTNMDEAVAWLKQVAVV